jgi:hypothetical protein
MRPFTQRQWRNRFAVAMINGATIPQLADQAAVMKYAVEQVEDAARTATSYATELGETFFGVWFWPLPEQEAAFELSAREAFELSAREFDHPIRGEGFVLVGACVRQVPALMADEDLEYNRPPFLVNGRGDRAVMV